MVFLTTIKEGYRDKKALRKYAGLRIDSAALVGLIVNCLIQQCTTHTLQLERGKYNK